eukprot:649936-Pyramimonas_sp.AAC.1
MHMQGDLFRLPRSLAAVEGGERRRERRGAAPPSSGPPRPTKREEVDAMMRAEGPLMDAVCPLRSLDWSIPPEYAPSPHPI